MNVGSGGTYHADPNETTEWEDILVKRGIITAREKKTEDMGLLVESGFVEEEEILEDKTLAELDELDEDDEFLDDHILNQYREARMSELKAQARLEKYGDVREIIKSDYEREVAEASNDCLVVCHLYSEGILESRLLSKCMSELAPRFKTVKFIRIVASNCIEGYPDKNVPTIVIYRDGECQKQLIGLSTLGGKRMKTEDLEWCLAQFGLPSDMEADPRDAYEERGANRIKLRTNFVARSSYHDEGLED